jgi:rhodanese-related sulfurtransferase
MPVVSKIVDVPAADVWQAMTEVPGAVLVDVRTDAEWRGVGIPHLTGHSPNLHLISWQFAPDMRVNERFLDDMAAAGIEKTAPIYFLCRSGVRSRAAAELAAAAGYGPCFNVAAGFEGVAGPDGRRQGGWRGAGLPEIKPAT